MLKRPAKSFFGDSKFARDASLRTKTFVGIFLVSLLLLAAWIVVVVRMLTSSFQEIQNQLSLRRVERVVSQLRQLAKIQALYAKNNSEWDYVYEFMTGELPRFLEDNYSSEDNGGGLQMVAAFDRNYAVIGRVVAGDEAIFETVDLDAVVISELLGKKGGRWLFSEPEWCLPHCGSSSVNIGTHSSIARVARIYQTVE